MAATGDVCGILDAITSAIAAEIGRLLRRLTMLRRLAEILTQVGSIKRDLERIYAQIQRLIPVYLIDANNYNMLRNSCPFLNLPDLGKTPTALQDFKNQVQKSYGQILKQLNSVPEAQLSSMQSVVDQMLNQIGTTMGKGMLNFNQIVQCINALCAAAAQGEKAFNQLSTAIQDGSIPQSISNGLENAGQGFFNVLDQGAQERVNMFRAAQSNMKELMSGEGPSGVPPVSLVTTSQASTSSSGPFYW